MTRRTRYYWEQIAKQRAAEGLPTYEEEEDSLGSATCPGSAEEGGSMREKLIIVVNGRPVETAMLRSPKNTERR